MGGLINKNKTHWKAERVSIGLRNRSLHLLQNRLDLYATYLSFMGAVTVHVLDHLFYTTKNLC